MSNSLKFKNIQILRPNEAQLELVNGIYCFLEKKLFPGDFDFLVVQYKELVCCLKKALRLKMLFYLVIISIGEEFSIIRWFDLYFITIK